MVVMAIPMARLEEAACCGRDARAPCQRKGRRWFEIVRFALDSAMLKRHKCRAPFGRRGAAAGRRWNSQARTPALRKGVCLQTPTFHDESTFVVFRAIYHRTESEWVFLALQIPAEKQVAPEVHWTGQRVRLAHWDDESG